MIVNPRHGQAVQVWYKASVAASMALHGKLGTVVIVCRYRRTKAPQVIEGIRATGPRNHGVEVDGVLWVVPCGNLRKAER